MRSLAKLLVLFAALFSAVLGEAAAPAVVSHNVASKVSALTAAMPVTLTGVTSGNLIVVTVAWHDGTVATWSSIGDGSGNTYTQIGSEFLNPSRNFKMRQYWAVATATGNLTITANFSVAPNSYEWIQAYEISGANTSSPIDGPPTTGSASTSTPVTVSAGSITTTGDALIVAGLSTSTTAYTFTAGSSLAITDTANLLFAVENGQLTGAQSFTSQMTVSTGGAEFSSIVACAIKASGGGGGGAKPCTISVMGAGPC